MSAACLGHSNEVLGLACGASGKAWPSASSLRDFEGQGDYWAEKVETDIQRRISLSREKLSEVWGGVSCRIERQQGPLTLLLRSLKLLTRASSDMARDAFRT